MLVQLNNVTKNFGGAPLLEEVSIQINDGQKIGMIGSNGSGKSTIFKLITGEEHATKGTVSCKKKLRIGSIKQETIVSDLSVAAYLLSSFSDIHQLGDQLRLLEAQMCQTSSDLEKIMGKYARVQEEYEQKGGYILEERIATVLKGLGLAEKATTCLDLLSGGEKVLVQLAHVLLLDVDIYLLDEPTNHLDTQSVEWLERYLCHTKAACLVVSHDRRFLDNVVENIIEVDDGEVFNYPGNYTRYQKLKAEREALIQKNYELQKKEVQKIKLAIRRYRQWGNEGDNEKFFKRAKHLEKRLEKMQGVKRPIVHKRKLGQKNQSFTRSGKEVLKVCHLSKFFKHRLLFEAEDFTIYWQERLALIGKNGSGKSTFFKMLLGIDKPTQGEIRLGSGVKIGYLAQNILYEEPKKSVLTYFQETIGEEENARRVLAQYGFYQEDVTKRLVDLSGGEKIRLELAKLFQQEVNFLILDEPINHLDIETREEIESYLEEFVGTILVTSHDRYFIDKLFKQCLMIREKRLWKQTIRDSE